MIVKKLRECAFYDHYTLIERLLVVIRTIHFIIIASQKSTDQLTSDLHLNTQRIYLLYCEEVAYSCAV